MSRGHTFHPNKRYEPPEQNQGKYFAELHFKPSESVMPYLITRPVPGEDIIENRGFTVCSDCAKRLSKGVKCATKLAELRACGVVSWSFDLGLVAFFFVRGGVLVCLGGGVIVCFGGVGKCS